MADFPNIQLPSSRERTVSKPKIKSEFESGHTQVRSKGTRAKQKWTLKWEHLPIAEWEILKAHFVSNSGSSFNISKKMIYETFDCIVIYSIDEIVASSSNATGHYTIEIMVEEL